VPSVQEGRLIGAGREWVIPADERQKLASRPLLHQALRLVGRCFYHWVNPAPGSLAPQLGVGAQEPGQVVTSDESQELAVPHHGHKAAARLT
jgi:hypothetical protein